VEQTLPSASIQAVRPPMRSAEALYKPVEAEHNWDAQSLKAGAKFRLNSVDSQGCFPCAAKSDSCVATKDCCAEMWNSYVPACCRWLCDAWAHTGTERRGTQEMLKTDTQANPSRMERMGRTTCCLKDSCIRGSGKSRCPRLASPRLESPNPESPDSGWLRVHSGRCCPDRRDHPRSVRITGSRPKWHCCVLSPNQRIRRPFRHRASSCRDPG
jgi:hypothetical protein